MYIILWWTNDCEYLTAIKNKDGSIMLFDTLKNADAYANGLPCGWELRVISIEAVKE